ncbi:unnamed protein product [Rotaria sp. Silwood1]|nr:unnamed protein product [Rotaria sp. Silwood1]
MGTKAQQTVCAKCKKTKAIVTCKGCSTDFCVDHSNEHHNELSEQLSKAENQFNQFKSEIEVQKAKPQIHELMKQIDQWEYESTKKIRQVADEVRHKLSSYINTFVSDQDIKLKQLSEKIIQYRKDNDFAEPDIQFFNEKLKD